MPAAPSTNAPDNSDVKAADERQLASPPDDAVALKRTTARYPIANPGAPAARACGGRPEAPPIASAFGAVARAPHERLITGIGLLAHARPTTALMHDLGT